MSRTWRAMIAAAFALGGVLVASGCQDGGRAAASALAAVEHGAPPPVEISPPEPGSSRAKALTALAGAGELVLYSLEPWAPPRPNGPRPEGDAVATEAYDRAVQVSWDRSQREWCTRDACLFGNRVLGRTQVRSAADRASVETAVRESLGQVPDYATACVAEFRHAVEFQADGDTYQVLLCYGCGQVGVAVNGSMGFAEQTYAMGEEAALDAILKAAGIPLAPKPH